MIMLLVYYRIYSEDVGIPSQKPLNLEDPYIGRIHAKSIAPPHTILSLKRCICKAEGITDHSRTTLFVANSSNSAMDDKGRISVSDQTGPGRDPAEPMALVVRLLSTERAAIDQSYISPQGETPIDPRFSMCNCGMHEFFINVSVAVYYRLYTADGDVTSKNPIDPDDASLARIDANLVPPPHTARSITRCISIYERDPRFLHSNLFVNIFSEVPIDTGHFSILAREGPGSSPEEPLALVECSPVEVASSSRRSAPVEIPTVHIPPEMDKKLKVIDTWGEHLHKI